MLDSSQRSGVDRAFIGHGLLAAALAWAGCFSWFDFTTAQALGFLTGVPTALIALSGIFMATHHSFRQRRAWGEVKALPLLLAIPVLIIAALVVAARVAPDGELRPWEAAFVFLHPVVALPVIVRWFGFTRRRHSPSPTAS